MKNNNTYIFALTLVATLGGLLFGYDTAVISGTVESLRKFFIEPQGLPLDQANALEGFVVSSALIGCILGASFAGWISQRYGRKPTLILAAILFLLSAIGSAWPELFIGMHITSSRRCQGRTGPCPWLRGRSSWRERQEACRRRG